MFVSMTSLSAPTEYTMRDYQKMNNISAFFASVYLRHVVKF